MIPSNFERCLIDSLQPVRHFVLAQVLFHAMDLGIFAAMAGSPGAGAGELAAELGLDEERLEALLVYLENEGYTVREDGWSLSAKGAGLPAFQPWYELLVGGYATTFQQLGAVLQKGAPWATRDTTRVGAGSCGISAYDALPLTERLLDSVGRELGTVIDVGCGDAAFLIELLVRRPGLRGIGMEPNLPSVHAGAANSKAAGIAGRLELKHGPAADVTRLRLPDGGAGFCFLTAFVLQEILEQAGQDAVEDLLAATFAANPAAHWIVIEVDHQRSAPVMAHGLGMAYYNPYYLIHKITEQRLETAGFWNDLFRRAGVECLKVAHPDDRVDSTRLELGYLLRRAA